MAKTTFRSISLPMLLCAMALPLGCAHDAHQDLPSTVASIDVIDARGEQARLSDFLGHVVVLDVCAAWSDACLLNARAMSSACEVLCQEDVEMMTILLDDVGSESIRGIIDVMHVKQKVRLAGPQTLAGRTVLGSVKDIPRLLIFDKNGEIVSDVVGAVMSAWGVTEKVRKLEH